MTNIIHQLLYSSDLVPWNFLIPLAKKLPLQNSSFDSIEAVNKNLLKKLKVIPEITNKKCFKDWKKGLHMFVASNRLYFDDNKNKY